MKDRQEETGGGVRHGVNWERGLKWLVGLLVVWLVVGSMVQAAQHGNTNTNTNTNTNKSTPGTNGKSSIPNESKKNKDVSCANPAKKRTPACKEALSPGQLLVIFLSVDRVMKEFVMSIFKIINADYGRAITAAMVLYLLIYGGRVMMGDVILSLVGSKLSGFLGFGSNTMHGKLFASSADLTVFSIFGVIGMYMPWKASNMAGALTGSLAVAFSMGHKSPGEVQHHDTKGKEPDNKVGDKGTSGRKTPGRGMGHKGNQALSSEVQSEGCGVHSTPYQSEIQSVVICG